MPEKKDPTHYSELDPKSMNVSFTKTTRCMFFIAIYIYVTIFFTQVNELRQELAARNLNCKGLKSQLLARLTKAATLEQAKEEGRQDDIEENEKDISPSPKEEEDKKFRDKDVRLLSHKNLKQ